MRTLCPGWAGQLSRRGVNLYWSSIRSPRISIPGPVRDTDRSQALNEIGGSAYAHAPGRRAPIWASNT